MVPKAQRHRQIVKLIGSKHITSQLDLAAQLSRVGISATQTTLSRDLGELGVVKSATGYRILEGGGDPPSPDRAAHFAGTVRRLLLEVSVGGTIAIAHTPPGQASALAVEVDRAGMPGILGTIAGDDCILIACASNAAASSTARNLQSIAQGSSGSPSRGGRNRSHAHS